MANSEQIWRIIGNQEANLKALTNLLDTHCADDERRHQENLERLDAIRDKQTSNADAHTETRRTAAETAAAVKDLTDRLEKMAPTLRRMRQREVFRRKFFQCIGRWRRELVAAGVTAGALFAWLDGHWPKIAAMLRKLIGPG